ncbi:MAG: hypothetical protein ACXVAY_17105 [Mucilaginibacter sp.]
MENAYKNVSLIFAGVVVIIFAGFYKTYFGLFPYFINITSVQHSHGLLFMLWFAILITQPILIRQRKYQLHRTIGKFTYLLVPLIVLSIFYIAKESYLKNPSQNDPIAGLFIPFFQVIDFVTLYLLAIINRLNSWAHMRYIITTSLAISGAAIRRIFTNLMGATSNWAYFYCFATIDLILITLIIYDIKNKNKLKPYLVSLTIIVLSQVGYYTIPQTTLWHTLCGMFVHRFF